MLDIIILILLIYAAVRGYMSGFVVQSLTLVALVGGIWAGIKFNPVFSGWLIKAFSLGEHIAPYVSFAVIFLAVIIVIHFIGVFITKAFSKTVLGGLNRIGGVLFGVAKMVFIISVVIFLIEKFDTNKSLISEKTATSSKLFNPIAKIAPAIFPHIHFEEFKERLLKG